MSGKPFDLTRKENIVDPSSDFRMFLDHYFLEPRIFIRGEEDPEIIQRLVGLEKQAAVGLIEANIEAGHDHLLRAAAYLKMSELVPKLQKILSQSTDAGKTFLIAEALFELGAIEEPQMYSVLETALPIVSNYYATDILRFSYRLTNIHQTAKLIEIGLRRDDYHTRCGAYNALIALEFICKNGGRYTDQIGKQIWDKECSWAVVGSREPNRYQEYQHYLADNIFNSKETFALRFAELKKRLDICTRTVPN